MKQSIAVLACIAAMTASGAWAAKPTSSDPAKAQYDAERARCTSGTTGQDQASCLRSAGAAYESSKQGRLKDPNENFQDNATARCKALPASDQADCLSRVGGEGTVHGSVRDGGVIKETVTRNVNESGTAQTNRPVPR